MEERQITFDDLLRKIGAMTIQLEIAQGTIEALKNELEKTRSLNEQKAESNAVDK
jgi:hypothetical protein